MLPAKVERDLNNKIESGRIAAGDGSILREYLYEYMASANPAKSSVVSKYQMIVFWLTACQIDALTPAEIYRIKIEMDQSALKKNTVRLRFRHFQDFLTWLYSRRAITFDPAMVKIKAPRADRVTITPSQILTREQVEKLLESCRHTRDRLIITILYEGGLRPVDAYTMRWRQVSFDEYGVKLTTDRKTGKTRYIRLLMTTEILAKWKNEWVALRGRAPEPEDPVFLNLQDVSRPMTYDAMRLFMKKCATRAGMNGRAFLYLLRHSRITHEISAGTPESIVKLVHWGSVSTGMLETYLHLTGQDIDKVVLERAGIIQQKKGQRTRVMTPVQCPDCLTICGPLAQYCERCGRALTELTVQRSAILDRAMQENPQVLIRLLQKRVAERERDN